MRNMPVNVERCRSELDDLETELDGWSHPNPPGVDLWTHKMYALIGEILDPNHALAIRLSGMRWGVGRVVGNVQQHARFRDDGEPARDAMTAGK